jgi:hypothetical protein
VPVLAARVLALTRALSGLECSGCCRGAAPHARQSRVLARRPLPPMCSLRPPRPLPLLQVHRDASLAALKAEADDQAAVIQVPWPLLLSNLMPPYLTSRSLASCRVIVCTPAPAR